MNTNNISKLTVILGIALLIIAYLILYNSMEFLLGQGLRPLGFVSLFINPILRIMGSIFSFRKK